MIKTHRFFLFCFVLLFSKAGICEIPVVDESENFAMLEQQQSELEQPITRSESYDLMDNDANELSEEHPLVGEPLAEESSQADPSIITNDSVLSYDGLDDSSLHDNAFLLQKLQSLQQEVQELRGQIEVQAHDLKLLQEQQLAFYKDLDARLSQRATDSGKTSSMAKQSPKEMSLSIDSDKMPALSASAKTNPANEQISYLAAYEFVKNKKYEQALTAMKTFVHQYPKSGYVANAQYWLGELYLVKKEHKKAITHFEVVLQNYPTSSKSSASLLKIGYALAAMGEKTEAKERLQQVVKKYPDTHTAKLATLKLKSL